MPFFLRMGLQGLSALIPFKSLLYIGLIAGLLGSLVLFVKIRDGNLVREAKVASDAVWAEKIAVENLKRERKNSDAEKAARNVAAISPDRAKRLQLCTSERENCRQDGK